MAEDHAVERIKGRYAVLAASIPAIIALAGAYVLGHSQVETAKELPKSPAITFTLPEGPTIRFKNRLEGTVSELRAGESVWTFFAETKDPVRVFPAPGPCPVTDGRWTCRDVLVGERRDTRRSIQLPRLT